MQNKKIHLLNWRKMTHNKKHGDLGFHVAREFNKAMLEKKW